MRWTSDDAFINFRIVENILNGDGPVYNQGIRVESGTSPLWLAVVTREVVHAASRLIGG